MNAVNDFVTAAGFAGRGAVSFAPASPRTITLLLTIGSLPLPATRHTTG